MNLEIIQTGSAGNGYALRASNGETLLIECGVKLDEVKKVLDYDLSQVVGCLMTHEHQDHSKYSKDYANAGIEIYSQKESFKGDHHNFIEFESCFEKFMLHGIGDFEVMPFKVKHDVPCLGFIIYHEECGKILFLTDSYYCPYKFSGLNQIIIEANYSKEIINKKYDGEKSFLRDRIKSSHMSLETCIDLLKSNDMGSVKNIVLIHLSDTNSDEGMFKREVQRATGKSCTVGSDGVVVQF